MGGSQVAEIIPPQKASGRARGRPTEFSPEIGDDICEHVANGNSLVSYCAFANRPSASTVFSWLRKYPEFAENLARARESLAEYYVSEIVDIADTPQIGAIVTDKPTGREVKRADMLGHRQLQIEARKWAASKLAPKMFGDRQTVKHEGLASASGVEITDDQAERLAREMLIGRGYDFDG